MTAPNFFLCGLLVLAALFASTRAQPLGNWFATPNLVIIGTPYNSQVLVSLELILTNSSFVLLANFTASINYCPGVLSLVNLTGVWGVSEDNKLTFGIPTFTCIQYPSSSCGIVTAFCNFVVPAFTGIFSYSVAGPLNANCYLTLANWPDIGTTYTISLTQATSTTCPVTTGTTTSIFGISGNNGVIPAQKSAVVDLAGAGGITVALASPDHFVISNTETGPFVSQLVNADGNFVFAPNPNATGAVGVALNATTVSLAGGLVVPGVAIFGNGTLSTSGQPQVFVVSENYIDTGIATGATPPVQITVYVNSSGISSSLLALRSTQITLVVPAGTTTNYASGFINLYTYIEYDGTGSVGFLQCINAAVRIGAASGIGTITSSAVMAIQPINVGSALATGTITSAYGISFINSVVRSVTLINQYCIDIPTMSGATVTIPIRIAKPSGTQSVAQQFSDVSGASGGGILFGNLGDLSVLYRPAANTLTTSGSFWIQGYSCVGCTSAPTNTNTGVLTLQPIVNPTSQAFGAVTASGVTGLLTFSVSTAASTCATAVITNTKVVSTSIVHLDIQGYTGTATDMISVRRMDTTGSATGFYTVQLCNRNLAGSLSGILYIAYEVRN